MKRLEAMDPESRAFLCELYTQSEGDARRGVPYETLIDALGFDEAVTKRLQGRLQQDGWVELTTVPPMTHVGRPVTNRARRYCREQTISLTPQGIGLVEDTMAMRHTAVSQPSSSPDYTAAI